MSSLPGSPPVPANLEDLVGTRDHDLRNENAVQAFSLRSQSPDDCTGTQVFYRHVADDDIFQESSGSTGGPTVILHACSGIDRDRVICNCSNDIGDTDPAARTADMDSILVICFSILLEPDTLNQEIIDVFQPHAPCFRWPEIDPFD